MSRVCVLGAAGFVGKNLLRDTNWTGVTRQELDLTDREAVKEYFGKHEYDVVIHCAVVGGSRLRPDDGEVFYKNLLMFENVAVAFKGKLIYFSSGAALRGNPPSDPYGMSKWLIDRRIETLPNAYSLRIWGCYGPGEPSTRFSAVCKKEGHVVINKDRYFDFIDIEDVNNWYFTKEHARECYNAVKSCGIEYCELGFRRKDHTNGPWFYTPESLVNETFGDIVTP